MPSLMTYEDAVASHIDAFLASRYGGRTPEVIQTEVMEGVDLISALNTGGKDVVVATSISAKITTQGTPMEENTVVGPHVAHGLSSIEVQVFANEWTHSRSVANDIIVALSNARVALPQNRIMFTQFQSYGRIENPPNVRANGYQLIFSGITEIGDVVWQLPAEDRARVGFPAQPAPAMPLTRVDIGIVVDGTVVQTIQETNP